MKEGKSDEFLVVYSCGIYFRMISQKIKDERVKCGYFIIWISQMIF